MHCRLIPARSSFSDNLMCEQKTEAASTSGSCGGTEDAEAVDVAIADALKSSKNRQTGESL